MHGCTPKLFEKNSVQGKANLEKGQRLGQLAGALLETQELHE